MKKLGVIGSLVWDVIHGRDPASAPVEEWGGIAYALSSLDAHLPPDWEIVPLIKVGRDLSAEAGRFINTLTHLVPGGRCIKCRCQTTAWCSATSPPSAAASA